MFSSLSSNRAHIAIVDCFKNKIIDIDGDNIPDMSHGAFIDRYAKTCIPSLKTDKFDVETFRKKEFSTEKLINAFYKIAKKIKDGKKYNAVNLSLGNEMQINDMSLFTNFYDPKTIDTDNVRDYKEELSDHYKSMNNRTNSLFNEIFRKNKPGNELSSIEEVTKQKVPVFVAAGNESSNSFNVYSLADGVTTVGGEDKTKSRVDYLAQNTLVDRYEKSYLNIKAVKTSEGKIKGYDINEDGKLDIKNSEVSGKGKLDNDVTIIGTSISAIEATINEVLNMLITPKHA